MADTGKRRSPWILVAILFAALAIWFTINFLAAKA